jgi:DNA-binding response OmpR family regulator
VSRTVLIVEDDPAIAEVLQLVLEAEGYAADRARDGLEALERLDGKRPDLILLDLMLPRMDGATFAAELERRGLRGGIPILILSALDQADRWAAHLRADGYLAKPFEVATLLDQVDRLMLAGAPAVA